MSRQVLTYPDIPAVLSPTIADAKGDLLIASGADSVTRLPLGTNNQVLTADSTQPLGVKWAAATGGGGLTQAEADLLYVKKPGDTMTGVLFQTGVRPVFAAKDNSSAAYARFGQVFAASIAYVTANALYDGSQWNLDDTATDGVVGQFYGALGQATFSLDRFPAGGNPATPRRKRQLELGATGQLSLYPDANVPGVYVYGGFPGINQIVVTNTATVTANMSRYTLYSGPNAEVQAHFEADHLGTYIGQGVALRVSTNHNFQIWTNNSPRLLVRNDGHVHTASSLNATGALTVGSTITAQGSVATQGGGSGFIFGSRTGEAGWLWYSTGQGAYLYSMVSGQQPVSIAPSGALTLSSTATLGVALGTVSLAWSSLYDSLIDGAGHFRFRRLPSGITIMRGVYSVAGIWFDEGITTPSVTGSAYLSLVAPAGDVTVNPSSGVFVPAGDNAKACGWSSARWSTVHAANGSIQTSHVSQKKDFAPLDPAACVSAVLETNWLSYTYIDPNPPAPVLVPAGETSEMRMQRTNNDAIAMEGYYKMVRDTAFTRKQKGYVLGSTQYHTDDLFGLADRRSANTQADLAVVACALQQALRDIAELKAKQV